MNAPDLITALRGIVAPGSSHLDVRLTRADIVALLGHIDGLERRPLTEMEAIDLIPTTIPAQYDGDLLWYCRAVERAHQIQGDTHD